MSRETGKHKSAAKRQTRAPKKGERSLEQQALTLETKGDHILADSVHHERLLSRQEKKDIQSSVEQLQLEAERLKEISNNPYKTRSRQRRWKSDLDTLPRRVRKGTPIVGRGAWIQNHTRQCLAPHIPTLYLGKVPYRWNNNHLCN